MTKRVVCGEHGFAEVDDDSKVGQSVSEYVNGIVMALYSMMTLYNVPCSRMTKAAADILLHTIVVSQAKRLSEGDDTLMSGAKVRDDGGNYHDMTAEEQPAITKKAAELYQIEQQALVTCILMLLLELDPSSIGEVIKAIDNERPKKSKPPKPVTEL